jgi:hypothetical protein
VTVELEIMCEGGEKGWFCVQRGVEKDRDLWIGWCRDKKESLSEECI